MAFDVKLTSLLTGATPSQLERWRRIGVLVPETRAKRPPLYSFRDLVALRTLVFLRAQTSGQRLARAFSTMDMLALTEHPSRYSLGTDGDTIVVLDPDSHQTVDLVRNPGNAVHATFADVFRSFEDFRGRPVVDFQRPSEHLQVDLRTLGGWPTVQNTRVPYDLVAQLVDNESVFPEDVTELYPNVSAAAAQDAVEFSAKVAAI